MINWILQKTLTRSDVLTRIKSALNGKDEIWEEVEVLPFSKDLPEITNKDGFNIIYGSTTFMLNAYKLNALKPGVFYDPEKFNMMHYVDKWKSNVLNWDGQLLLFGDLSTIKSDSEKWWFIRPNGDGKSFAGKVDSFKNLVKWSQEISDLDLPEFNKSTEVWMASPKSILKEWRIFVVDNCIVSASRYMKAGELDESSTDLPEEMIAFAQRRILEYRLHDVYVMDIAEVEDGYKLIECNCFNGTGFYKHDLETIVRSVNKFVKENLIMYSD